MNHLKSSILAAALAMVTLTSANAQTAAFTKWDFNTVTVTNSPETSIGTGTASLLNGVTATTATGNGGGLGWNTSTYAAQGTGSGTRGVQFLVSTLLYSNITVSFDHRASGTNSRWSQVDYTLNGTDWVTGFWNNNGALSPHDTFYSFNVDFSSITAANNNANFGFRIVSIFSPTAFDQSSTLAAYAANTAYMRANAGAVYSPTESTATGDYGTSGTWRFDNVTVSGVPEPSPAALLGFGTLALLGLRRLNRKS